MRGWGPAAALLAGWAVAWEALVRAGGVEDFLLPAPTQIAAALGDHPGPLGRAALATAGVVLLGLALALALGFALALLVHLSGTLERALLPLLVATQTVPVVAFAPLLAAVLGYGDAPKLVIVVLVSFFPVVVAVSDALRRADEDLDLMLAALGAGRLRRLWIAGIPGALPAFFSSARLAGAYAVVGAVVGEWVAGTDGLGYLMNQASAGLETAEAFAAGVLLTLIGGLLFAATRAAERLATPWRERS
jgi:ABC-type nitrate/sulfonate/bicarbonate transport system permease component